MILKKIFNLSLACLNLFLENNAMTLSIIIPVFDEKNTISGNLKKD